MSATSRVEKTGKTYPKDEVPDHRANKSIKKEAGGIDTLVSGPGTIARNVVGTNLLSVQENKGGQHPP